MKKTFNGLKKWALIALLLSVCLFVGYSRVVARRIGDEQIRLLKRESVFYEQILIPHYSCLKSNWHGAVWEVRYDLDELSGFTCNVRVSLFGNLIDSNIPE